MLEAGETVETGQTHDPFSDEICSAEGIEQLLQGGECNDSNQPCAGMEKQQGGSARVRDHGQGTHFLIVLSSKLWKLEIMYVKRLAPHMVHGGTVTIQTNFEILLGELSSELVTNSIDGHLFIILP